MAYEWAFDWPDDCDGPSVADATSTTPPPTTSTGQAEPDGEGGVDVVVPPGFDTVTYNELPPEALDTLALIASDGPFRYRQDGAVFQNREGILPDEPDGYYHEYTVETPGSDDRGARRIVTGEGGEVFYTDDHYDSFRVVVP
ncbi:ribonuclease domain-containing protein [Desertimonas flava]|uniref:ribonuclease domain-containing protein n=1 Tax=Desertimonas flava TaxID=2064846 RepID=UPI000E345987